MWINQLIGFEANNTRERRRVRGFYNTSGKTVKTFEKAKVKIPSELINLQSGKLEEIIQEISDDSDLSKCSLTVHVSQNYHFVVDNPRVKIENWDIQGYGMIKITNPHDLAIEKKLPAQFQKGDYEKLSRFEGEHPERKVILSQDMEEAFELMDEFQFQENQDRIKAKTIDELLKRSDKENRFELNSKLNIFEANLNSSNGIQYIEEFLTPEELDNVSTLYIDIEKCLWKHDDEKDKIKERERLIFERYKLERRIIKRNELQHQQKVRELTADISRLESELMVNIPGLGVIPMYDDKFNARISWIITKWKNPCNSNEKSIRELFVMDPRNEFNYGEYQGSKVVKSKTEQELLLEQFRPRIRSRRPLVIVAYNGAYDNTQIRMAFNETGEIFDPVVSKVQPRRDQVIEFLQRMKQDAIYLDPLWLTRIFAPYLGQRSLGSNFKLASSAKHHGIVFEKIMNHEDLRTHEAIRLSHPDPEKRKESLEKLATYAGGDVDPLEIATEREKTEFIYEIKRSFPYLTSTQISFSTACADWIHDKIHFDRVGNIRFAGYNSKRRRDEIDIFTNRFNDLNRKRLNQNGIVITGGEAEDVRELYIPLEEWISPIIFHISPEFKRLNEIFANNPKQKFALLQYMRTFARDIFADYYFARKENAEFKNARKPVYLSEELYQKDSTNYRILISAEDKRSLLGAFNGLKDVYRAVYVPLQGNARRLIRPNSNHLANLEIPNYFADESDLVLLYENAAEIRKLLNSKGSGNVSRFVSSYVYFKDKLNDISQKLKGKVEDPEVLAYCVMREQRAKRYERAFYARYRTPYLSVGGYLSNNYQDLARSIQENKATVLDIKGQYLFVKSLDILRGTYQVRRIPYYNPEQSKPLEKKETGQLELAI